MPFIFKVPKTLSYVEMQKLLASDGIAGESFGENVAIESNTVVISAPGFSNGPGAAYVFEWNGSSWIQVQKLKASDGLANDLFSGSVAISGSTIVIGANAADPGGNNAQGAAYVFEKSGTWPATETQKLLASDGLANDNFGASVAISGTTIIIGVRLSDPGGVSNQGAAYVFEKSGTWPATETQKLLASDGIANDNFGISVSIDGTTIVVGAWLADIGANNDQGAVYVFEYNSISWLEVQKLLASDGLAGDTFGRVAISGTTLVVGSNNKSPSGAAYVFEYNSISWLEVQKLLASDGLAGDNFGGSVAISGTTIVVGANSVDPSGAAYAFEKSGTWPPNETQKLLASDGLAGDAFGGSVAISGTTIVVGAGNSDPGGNLNQGSVYVYT